MKAGWLPLVAHDGRRRVTNAAPNEGVPVGAHEGARGLSLMTPLGLMSGEVLIYLEAYGATTVRQLIQVLKAPMSLVTMGVGALIREGLVRGSEHGTEVLVELS